MASQSQVFTLLGDSNVQRHMNPMSCRDRPMMSTCQVLPCGRISAFAETLRAVRPESNVVIVACLTNFLTSSVEAGSSVVFRIEPVLRDSIAIINEFAVAHQDIHVVVSPPMYRQCPIWYRDCLPEVMTKFSDVFGGRACNVSLMSSFATPVLESDGVHLTAYSGLEYVLYLFDTAISVLRSLSSSMEEVVVKTVESTRVLEDRMMAIEQDHRRLNVSAELKSAEDAELFDFQQNIRFENCFTITGLTRHPEGLSPKEWQERVKRDVQGALTVLMGREYSIIVVLNSTSKRKDAPATYHVQLAKLEDSKEIRDKFGSYFLGRVDARPEALKAMKFSISNRVTPATSTRINILKALGKRYVASNPGSRFQVINYEPRPVLKLTPPSDAKDRRVQTYNYIEAIRTLPVNFTDDELAEIVPRVSPKLHGKLRAVFNVISDDMVKRFSGSRKSSKKSNSEGLSANPGNGSGQSSGRGSGRGAGSGGRGSGRGSSRGQHSSAAPDATRTSPSPSSTPVAPAPATSPSGGSPTDPRVTQKRGATSPASGGPSKQSK